MTNGATDIDSTTIALGLQLAISGGMALLMVVTHSVGMFGISRVLKLGELDFDKMNFGPRVVWIVALMGGLIFLLHLFEIAIFAAFYMAVGAMQSVEEALYYSASAYATLGWMADFFPTEWRLIGAIEALLGFILIGWSTAFMVGTMRKLSN